MLAFRQGAWARSYVLALAAVTVTSVGTAGQDSAARLDASHLRFDGLYRYRPEKEDEPYRFYRFHEDGTVITGKIPVDSPSRAAQLLRRNGKGGALLAGNYEATGTDLTFSLRSRGCRRCPVEENYRGRLKGDQIDLELSSELTRGVRGKRRDTLNLTFVETPIPIDAPQQTDLDRELTAIERTALGRVPPAKIRVPKPEVLQALNAARTIRIMFGGGDYGNFSGVYQILNDYPVVATFAHLSELAGLTVLDAPGTDAVVIVDRVYSYEETVSRPMRGVGPAGTLITGKKISGRLTVEIAAGRSSYQVEFKGSQKGPWYHLRTGTTWAGMVRQDDYGAGKVDGDAFEEGFIRTLKALLELRQRPKS